MKSQPIYLISFRRKSTNLSKLWTIPFLQIRIHNNLRAKYQALLLYQFYWFHKEVTNKTTKGEDGLAQEKSPITITFYLSNTCRVVPLTLTCNHSSLIKTIHAFEIQCVPVVEFQCVPVLEFKFAPVLEFQCVQLLDFQCVPVLEFKFAPVLEFQCIPDLEFQCVPDLEFQCVPGLISWITINAKGQFPRIQ